MCQAQKEDEEIEPPQHLQDTRERVVAGHIEEREVSKTCHPQVASNHNPNTVVYLRSMSVVIHQEGTLHPTFPLVGLAIIQNFTFG